MPRTCPRTTSSARSRRRPAADGETYEDIRYEGYGPGGAALIVEAQTDNRNRTASDVRSAFTKSGGSLAETGAVAFLFDRVGVIAFYAQVADADTMLEAAIDAGADDVRSGPDGHEVVCAQDSYGEVARALEARFGEPSRTGLIWKAQNTIDVDDETGEKLIRLVEVIEDQDDVQHVYVNFALSETLMAKLEA